MIHAEQLGAAKISLYLLSVSLQLMRRLFMTIVMFVVVTLIGDVVRRRRKTA
jgi:hypothetical protein